MPVVVIAGHADHGKSALIRALTGARAVPLTDERSGGTAADLGFGRVTLPSGDELTIFDVPGHERFAGSMLSGVGALPAVLFVVAADQGWTPESAEHLAVISALGISRCLLVVTKADIADPAPVLAEAGAAIARSGIGAVPAVAVSSATKSGLPELVKALDELVRDAARPHPDTPVRIWIDRAVGTATGVTAVTGMLPAGTLRTGDHLCVTPSMRPVRVDELQSLGEPAMAATGVTRVALSLSGVAGLTLHRGMALVQPGRWTLTDLIDVRISAADPVKTPGLLPPTGGTSRVSVPQARDSQDRDLQDRDSRAGDSQASNPPGGDTAAAGVLARTVTVHAGPARVLGRVRPLGPGVVRLSLADALPLHAGDRILLRDPAGRRPGLLPAVAGAIVLDVAPPALARRGAAAAAAKMLASWPDRPGAAELLTRHGLLRASVLLAMGIEDQPLPVTGEWLADPERWRSLSHQLGEVLAHHAAAEPMAGGLPIDLARAALDLPDRRLVLALAKPPFRISCGALHIARPPGRDAAAQGLPEPVLAAVRVLRADLSATPFASPDAERLRKLGLDSRGIAAAVRAGELMRISEQVVLAPGADVAAAAVIAKLEQPFTAAQARQALGTTRRTAIPLLEYLDSVGITQRLPDDRRVLRRTTPQVSTDAEASDARDSDAQGSSVPHVTTAPEDGTRPEKDTGPQDDTVPEEDTVPDGAAAGVPATTS
jgi:selenocysteine-specific elongation factor